MCLMDRDDITDAFARWKMAQDAFLATEQRFFATVGKCAHQFPAKRVHEADPLFIEVQAKRAHAEGLLLVAMKLLHERRHPGESTPKTEGESEAFGGSHGAAAASSVAFLASGPPGAVLHDPQRPFS
jgi:hypothetical protein